MVKFTISRQDLLNAVQAVNRSAKSSVEILNTIRIEARGDLLTLTTTDIELTLVSKAPAQVAEEGEICLPMRQIAGLVKELPDVNLEIYTEKDASAVIAYNSSRVSLKGYPADQFPVAPDLSDPKARFTLSQGLMKEIIRQTAYAAATSRERPIFTGVNFDIANDRITFAATDTHRMAVKKIDLDTQQSLNVTVPERALNELSRLLQNDVESMKVVITANMISFGTKTAAVISQLVSGQYPNYNTVIPSNFGAELSFKRSDLADTLSRAIILSDDVPTVLLDLGEAARLQLKTQVGSINETIKATYKGEPMKIYFNARYAYEAIKAMPAEEVTLYLTGPKGPAVFKPTGKEGCLALVLPSQPKAEQEADTAGKAA